MAHLFVGCSILVAAIIPSTFAAPQSNSGIEATGAVLHAPGLGSNAQHQTPVTPDTLLGTLSATPSSVTFSSVAVGLTNTQTVSLTNTGSATVQISRASIAGIGFRESGLTASTTISPGQTITFNLSFRPSSATTVTATATIYSNASNSPLVIPLTGTGTTSTVSLGFSPASLSFGNVTIGASDMLHVTLTNSGNVNVTIYKVNVPSSVFSTSGVSSGLILAPSQAATLNVTYAPTSATSAGGSVSITSSASSTSIKIPVSGSGVEATAQSVSLGWAASVSQGVMGYYVYRGTISGGPYSAITSSYITSTQYTDSSVQSGGTYYYVVTSVDSDNQQSGFSSQVSAKIPAQ